MPRLFHPLLKMIAHATHRDLAAQVQYLKVENEILRSKLPKRITVTPAEKAVTERVSSHALNDSLPH